MSKRKTKIVSYALFVLMALVVLLSVVATYAYYSDKREYSSTLTFGNIQIDANNETGSNSYFASSTLTNAQAGDYILNNDVNFNLNSGSEPAYIRAKYTASLNENKNLFNMGTASNYTAVLGNKNSLAVLGNTLTFTSDGSGSPGVLNNDIHEYTTGTAYTLSRSSGTRYLLRILDNNKQNITAGTISISGWTWNQWYKCYLADSSPATFSFSDASVKYFQIGFATNQNAGIVEQYTNVQLELGTTATSYAESDYNYFNTQEVASSVGSVDQYNVTTSVSSDYVITQTGTNETSSGGYSQFKIHLPSGNYKYNFQILSKSADTLTTVYLWRAKNTVSNNVFSKYDLSGNCNYSTDFVITGEADYYVAVYGKLLKGQTMTFKISITKPDSHLANYFKYKDLSANLFDISKVTTAKNVVNNNDGTLAVTPTSSSSAVTTGNKLKELAPNLVVGKTYTLNAKTDGTGVQSHQIWLNVSQSVWTFGTSKTITQNDLDSTVFWYANGNDTTFTATISDITITDGSAQTYCWSDKIGDYYYLLDSTTGEPLEVNDSSKTYTFLTKESSKIADDTFFGEVSGNSVKLEISIEAIQSANITSLDSSKTLLENIKTALDQIYNVSTSGSFSVSIVVDGVAYTKTGIAYASDVTLDDAVITKLKTAGVGGLAFYENGYPVITTTGNNHSSLDLKNGKLKNITENLTLYVVNKSQNQNTSYTVTFKNGSTTLQTSKASTGNCYYFGEIPTKASTSSKYYEFAGWKKSGDTTVYTDLSDVTISADTTFEAVFNEYSLTYNISFDLNGGYFLSTATVPASYTYGTSVTLPTEAMMSKPGYAFAGWFENADFSGTAVTSISATTVGNKTYYAKWTAS